MKKQKEKKKIELADINLEELTNEQLLELQKAIKKKKMQRWRASDDYLRKSIMRTLKSIEGKDDMYGEDFLDDIADEIKYIKEIKNQTEQ